MRLTQLTSTLTLGFILLSPMPASMAAENQAASNSNKQPSSGEAFVRAIEQAHGKKQLSDRGAIRANLKLQFGGETRVNGTLLTTPTMGRVRIELRDGGTLIFNDGQSWVSPADHPIKRARFTVLTWPYFFLAPFKLSDPGVSIEPQGEKTLDGQTYATARMTFGSGVGDSPDDWFLLYRNPRTNRLKAMAYIVTYDKSQAEAEKNPHAIVYSDFTTVEGVTLARQWQFRKWEKERGVHGDPLGRATLSQIEFVDPEPGQFDKPDDSREVPPPGDGGG